MPLQIDFISGRIAEDVVYSGVEWTSKVDLLAITTPILAYAGVSIGASWKSFAKIGWKAAIVGACVLMGTYMGSAIISEIVLRIQGVI